MQVEDSLLLFSSAGVGRTGVFLAIDMILTKLEKGVINSIDVFGEICAMRERRMNMVQTLVGYFGVRVNWEILLVKRSLLTLFRYSINLRRSNSYLFTMLFWRVFCVA